MTFLSPAVWPPDSVVLSAPVNQDAIATIPPVLGARHIGADVVARDGVARRAPDTDPMLVVSGDDVPFPFGVPADGVVLSACADSDTIQGIAQF